MANEKQNMENKVNVAEIKEKIDKILKFYEVDEINFGGYTATERLLNDAPEDYIEYRTDWECLKKQADDMYYMLNDIKYLLEDCKELL
jgi:hypothetical protein